MAMISCDLRYGHTEEQKHKLADGLLRVVSEVTGDPLDNCFYVLREGPGANFVEHGFHMPEYVEGAANDKNLIAQLG
jgi:4-oxalocrotonate tautomerase